MQRGFQRTAQQQRQSGLQRTTQLLSSTEGRVTRAPAQRAPLSGTLTILPSSVSGVQRGMRRSCVLSGRWLSPRRRAGQANTWTRGPSAQPRHVELLASCQRSQRAMSLHGSASNCACVTGASRASAARRQADSSARRCTARGPSGRRGFCVSPPGRGRWQCSQLWPV